MEPFKFEVGPPDDAADPALMRIGLASRKAALKNFTELHKIIEEFGGDFGELKKVTYRWQGMISLAAYAVIITKLMVEGEAPHLEEKPTNQDLIKQIEAMVDAFTRRAEEQND